MEDSENSASMGVPPDKVVVGMPSTISTMVKVGKIIDCEDDQTTILVAENIFKKFGDGITDGSVFQIKGRCRLQTIVRALSRSSAIVAEDTISLPTLMCDNLQVSIGDEVIMTKTDIYDLTKIICSPIFDEEEKEEEWHKLYWAPYIEKNNGIPLHQCNVIVLKSSNGKRQAFYIKEVIGGNEKFPFGVMNKTTNIEYTKAISQKEIDDQRKVVGYEHIGGLNTALAEIRNMVELPLCQPEIFKKIGAPYPRGVLLFGPPGCGKTNIARAIANETGVFLYVINGPEIIAKLAGDSEDNLRTVFKECAKNAPSILFLDEIDAIAPKRDKVQGELEKRIVAQLLTCMDGLESRNHVIVIGATNRPNSLDPALRRYGRFDKEVHIGIPDKEGRLEILKIHTKKMELADDVDLEKIADGCHGYVGADLASLAAEAALHYIQRKMSTVENPHQKVSNEFLNGLAVRHEDFEAALKKSSPSALREALIETPNVTWDQIGGMNKVKDDLKEMLELPLKYPNQFASVGMKPSRGILFYGPPGCGKTMIAKAVARDCNANFISVKGPELLTMWFGESEANIRDLFTRARAGAPCVIFFDEVDSIAPARGQGDSSGATDRVINQLLTEMDGMDSKKSVFVIGATNRPDTMDAALLRPGRLDQLVYIPLPDEATRKAIFKVNLKSFENEEDIDFLAKNSHGYSGADIAEICQCAYKHAIRDWVQKITAENCEKCLKGEETSSCHPIGLTRDHLKYAMQNTRRSVSENDIKAFEMFAQSKENGGSDNSSFDFPVKEASCSEPVTSNQGNTAADDDYDDDRYD